MKKGLLTAGVAVTLIGGGIAGTTAFAASDSQDDDVSQEQLEKAASITKDEAISASLEEVPGKAVETELDDEDNKPVYEVDVKGEDGKMWDLEVDAKSGDVLNSEKEGRDDDDDDELSDQEEQKQLKEKADITKKESESIALEEVKGNVTGNELDNEDDSVVYSVEIKDDQGTEHEVQVDAKTGDVLNTEQDDDNEDGDDNEDEEDDDDENGEEDDD